MQNLFLNRPVLKKYNFFMYPHEHTEALSKMAAYHASWKQEKLKDALSVAADICSFIFLQHGIFVARQFLDKAFGCAVTSSGTEGQFEICVIV